MQRFRSFPAHRGEGRHVRQSGPPGRFAHVILEVRCVDEPVALSIEWDAPEESIPACFRDAVVRAVVRSFESGGKYCDFSSEGLVIRVIGGTTHSTDSNEGSFEIATVFALREVLERASD